jgi:RimJ/RimL family protein N-acetyltransferase
LPESRRLLMNDAVLIEARENDFRDLIQQVSPSGLQVADGGIDTPEVLAMLRDLSAAVGKQFVPNAWMMVEDGEVVGLCSLLAAPTGAGAAMIGYGVAASRRVRGIASRAVADMVTWARRHERIRALTAETAFHNVASHRVLERNGFARVGERVDREDGALLCWRVEVK